MSNDILSADLSSDLSNDGAVVEVSPVDQLVASLLEGRGERMSRKLAEDAIRRAYEAGAASVKSKLGRPSMGAEEASERLAVALAEAGFDAGDLSLVEYGGSATAKSVFHNAVLDRSFERTFVSVLKAVQSGRPLSNLGCGTGKHGNTSRTVRTDCDRRRKENRGL